MRPLAQQPAPRGAGGFTLIEVMIALVVVAIVTAFALPAYNDSVINSHRNNAKAILTEQAQFMERYFTTNNGSYASAPLIASVEPKGATGTSVRYEIAFESTPTAGAYKLTATPKNGQLRDGCGALSITQTGAQTAAKPTCW